MGGAVAEVAGTGEQETVEERLERTEARLADALERLELIESALLASASAFKVAAEGPGAWVG
jgi:primosomal protein N''